MIIKIPYGTWDPFTANETVYYSDSNTNNDATLVITRVVGPEKYKVVVQ